MLVCEWRNYWGWEGLDSALYYEMDNVPQQLQVVGLDEMAKVIVVARNRYDELRARGKEHNKIIKDDKFKKFMKHCEQLDSEVDSILLQFVKDNIEVFPRRHNGHDL
ncbi:TPA: hypothetical protein ACH7IY_001305 [Escherichia coli]|nr:hypothetical protein [Escherichia coli]